MEEIQCEREQVNCDKYLEGNNKREWKGYLFKATVLTNSNPGQGLLLLL